MSSQYPLERRLVGSMVSLLDIEKRKILPLPGFKLRPLNYPASSCSLYGLRYPVVFVVDIVNINWYILVENENE
jgi:hypothetical protein